MPDDLVAPEGVDEGSADEEPRVPPADTLGARVGPPPAQPSPPLPVTETAQAGPGQQLAEGEG